VKRSRLDDRDLEVAVGSIAQACRSGETLSSALRSANHRHPSITITRLLHHHDSGMSIAAASQRIADETAGSPDALLTANVIAMAATVGGPAEHHFDALAHTLADRRNAAAERNAQASTARASMRVMTWIPLVVGGWLAIDDHTVRHTMFATTTGVLCLASGLILNVVGRFWAKSLINAA
jgi:Flp pilus assembly protein TadB